MSYRWEVESTVEIGRSRPVKRYMVTTLGGYFPVVAKLGPNSLAVVHRTGDFHNGERGRLEMSLSEDGGETWSRGQIVADHASDCRNPAFGVTSDGTLVLAYTSAEYSGGRPDRWNVFADLYVRRSTDGGQTWSEPTSFRSDIGDLGGVARSGQGASPYGKIVELDDGTLLMNVYTHGDDDPSKHWTYVVRSRDGGITWGDQTRIPIDDGDETCLLALPSGVVLAGVRVSGARVTERIYVMSSSDGGRSWSEPRRVTDTTQIPGDMIHLADGRVLLTFGHRTSPYGVRALVSRDEGETWDHDNTIILVADSVRADCGYPSSAQLDDGSIFTAYYAYESTGPFQDRALDDAFGMHFGPHCAGVKYSAKHLP